MKSFFFFAPFGKKILLLFILAKHFVLGPPEEIILFLPLWASVEQHQFFYLDKQRDLVLRCFMWRVCVWLKSHLQTSLWQRVGAEDRTREQGSDSESSQTDRTEDRRQSLSVLPPGFSSGFSKLVSLQEGGHSFSHLHTHTHTHIHTHTHTHAHTHSLIHGCSNVVKLK